MRRIRTPRKGSLTSRIMRTLRGDSGLGPYSHYHEKSEIGISTYYQHPDFPEETMNAMLEAEKHKAKGISEYQRSRFAR
jgi:hypothetical protein